MENPKILALAAKTRVRRVKEALIIHDRDKKGKVTMNRDKGVELSAMWYLFQIRFMFSLYVLSFKGFGFSSVKF